MSEWVCFGGYCWRLLLAIYIVRNVIVCGVAHSTRMGNDRESGSHGGWCFDVSFTDDQSGCPSNQCGMGRDQCSSLGCRNTAWLGAYAIFIR